MLYATFEKIKNEAQKDASSSIQIDTDRNMARLNINFGSILELELNLTFFSSH